MIDEKSATCVICDFGCAHYLGDAFSVVRGLETPLRKGLTYRYAAPELLDIVLNHESLLHDSEGELKFDVYAFAITMYEVITGSTVWKDLSKYEIYDLVSDSQRPDFLTAKRLPELNVLVEIIKSAWDQNPSARPSFHEIHEIIQKSLNK